MVFTSARVAAIVASSSGRRSVLTIHSAMLAMSFVFMPRVVQAGVPRRSPLGRNGGRVKLKSKAK